MSTGIPLSLAIPTSKLDILETEILIYEGISEQEYQCIMINASVMKRQ